MSDPKRATFITVGATKNVKNNVNKTVRLTINLDESNESKYPELNYKELVIAAARKKKTENGKTAGLDPFSDNDDDVERVARKFEQKYGGKSTYGRKGRSKYDEFADIGAGYDENDSFIDNTDGYDEMIPPECDTIYGGFYINCGSLEFKTVPENTSAVSDGEPNRNLNRNKRRISSSSSDVSSDSSSESDSQDAKDPKVITNGDIDSHKTEHRKKKNKNVDKKKAKKIRRTDSSAATSGKQTSDDNAPADAESGDSRTSQSDSLTSKPAPSSENPITSDSSRDTEAKVELKLPPALSQLLEELEALSESVKDNSKEADSVIDQHAVRVERALNKAGADKLVRRVAWGRASRALHVPRARLLQRSRAHNVTTTTATATPSQVTTTSTTVLTTTTTTTIVGTAVIPSTAISKNTATTSSKTSTSTTISKLNTTTTINKTNTITTLSKTNTTTTISKSTPPTSAISKTTATAPSKRKAEDKLKDLNVDRMTPEEKESKIVETLRKLKELIEERKPSMMAAYNAECERVQEERKKMALAYTGEGAPHVDRRLPKRRFPWCVRSRALLARLAHLAATPTDAAKLMYSRVLPLFPAGFVRMPTLLRQADLNKEIKASDVKWQRPPQTSTMYPHIPISSPQPFSEPIQFPSSLTVTTTVKQSDKGKSDDKDTKYDTSSPFGSVVNTFTLNKDASTEKADEKKSEAADKNKEDYIPNNIGSITITPVPSQQKTEKKLNNSSEKSKEPLLRVKSPAALNEMVNKKEKQKKDKTSSIVKEKRIDSPLHIDTGYQSKKEPSQSPKTREEISQKHIENMRIAENNIPRPTLVAVNHSPTFAKPDKRPPDIRKKKEVLIVSDLDPLADCVQEPLAVDDSSSDVEVIEEKLDKSEPKSDSKSDKVPSKDKVSDAANHKKVNSVKPTKSVCSKDKEYRKETERTEQVEDASDNIHNLLRDIREMGNSQKLAKVNCNSFGGVINNAKNESSKYNQPVFNTRSDKDKLAERASLNKMDGCNAITGQ